MKLISEFLEKLGFSGESAKLFIALTKNGPLTLLEASRKAGLERTRLYRLIDELKERGLVEEIPAYKRRTIKAASLSTLEMMVREQEVKSKSLTGSFPALSQALQALTHNVSTSNVIYYRGVEGIKQMTWHLLQCKGLWRMYSYSYWDSILGKKFVLDFNHEVIKRGLRTHDIYSDSYIRFIKQWKAIHGEPEGNWTKFDSRYIPEKILKIDQNIDIYNNVVSYYNWEGDDIFGVEIYNERIAKLQKQIHDILFKHFAKKNPAVDWTKSKKS